MFHFDAASYKVTRHPSLYRTESSVDLEIGAVAVGGSFPWKSLPLRELYVCHNVHVTVAIVHCVFKS